MRRLRAFVVAACWVGGAAGASAQPGSQPPPPDPIPVDPEPAPPAPEPTPPGLAPEPARPAVLAGGRNAQIYASLPALDLPPVDPDTLAFGSTFEMASAQLDSTSSGRASDGIDNETTTFALVLGTRYFQSLERRAWAYSVVASGDDSLNRVPSTGGSLFTNRLALAAAPEARFYVSAPGLFFLYAAADINTAINSTKDTGDADTSDSLAPGSIGIGAGAGFGRVLSIDPTVRLRRLEQALREQGILSGEIPQAVGTEIVRTWYALRNDIGTYKTLAYTMKHLSDGGLLTADPDLRSTYEALQVLGDPFIVDRRHGWEARGGVGVVQPFVGFDELDEPDAVIAILASMQYERPLDTRRQLSLRGKLLFDLGSADTGLRPYNLRAFAAYTEVFYNDTYDPLGALSLSGEAGVSGVRAPGTDPELGFDVLGSLAYSRLLNRGSLATGAVNLAYRNDGVFSLILSVGITWGIATGYFTPYTPAAVGI